MIILETKKQYYLAFVGTLVILISLVFIPMMIPGNPDFPWGINGYVWMWGFWIDVGGEYMGMLTNVSIYGIILSIIIFVFALKNIKLLLEFRKNQNFAKKQKKYSLIFAILTICLTILWFISFLIIPLGGTNLYNYHIIGYGFIINIVGGGLVLFSVLLKSQDPEGS